MKTTMNPEKRKSQPGKAETLKVNAPTKEIRPQNATKAAGVKPVLIPGVKLGQANAAALEDFARENGIPRAAAAANLIDLGLYDTGSQSALPAIEKHLSRQLAAHAADTGIPAGELHTLCLRAGLDLLDKGSLVIRKGDPMRGTRATRTKPVFQFPPSLHKEVADHCDGLWRSYLGENDCIDLDAVAPPEMLPRLMDSVAYAMDRLLIGYMPDRSTAIALMHQALGQICVLFGCLPESDELLPGWLETVLSGLLILAFSTFSEQRDGERARAFVISLRAGVFVPDSNAGGAL